MQAPLTSPWYFDNARIIFGRKNPKNAEMAGGNTPTPTRVIHLTQYHQTTNWLTARQREGPGTSIGPFLEERNEGLNFCQISNEGDKNQGECVEEHDDAQPKKAKETILVSRRIGFHQIFPDL